MGLDGVMIVMNAEKEFGITITDAEAEAMRVVEDLHLLVMRKLADRDPDPTEIWRRVQDIVIEETGTSQERVKPGARWSDVGVN